MLFMSRLKRKQPHDILTYYEHKLQVNIYAFLIFTFCLTGKTFHEQISTTKANGAFANRFHSRIGEKWGMKRPEEIK